MANDTNHETSQSLEIESSQEAKPDLPHQEKTLWQKMIYKINHWKKDAAQDPKSVLLDMAHNMPQADIETKSTLTPEHKDKEAGAWLGSERSRERLQIEQAVTIVNEEMFEINPVLRELASKIPKTESMLKSVRHSNIKDSSGTNADMIWYTLPTYGRGLWKPTRVTDEYGVVFRAFNKKGSGDNAGSEGELVGEPTREDMWIRGLATIGDVHKDGDRCEYWLQRSRGKLRVRRYVGEQEISKVPVQGEMKDVKDIATKYDRKARKAGLGLAVVRNPYTVGDAFLILSDGDKSAAEMLLYSQADILCDEPGDLGIQARKFYNEADIENLVITPEFYSSWMKGNAKTAGEQAAELANIGLLQSNANMQNLTMSWESKDLADDSNEIPLSVFENKRDFAIQIVDYFVAMSRLNASMNLSLGKDMLYDFDDNAKVFMKALFSTLNPINRFNLENELKIVFQPKELPGQKPEEGDPILESNGYWADKGMMNRMLFRPQGAFADSGREEVFEKKISSFFEKG
jgi:hypothetical protein